MVMSGRTIVRTGGACIRITDNYEKLLDVFYQIVVAN